MPDRNDCPDCDAVASTRAAEDLSASPRRGRAAVSRRQFIVGAAAGLAASSVIPGVSVSPGRAADGDSPQANTPSNDADHANDKPQPETLVAQLYQSLSDEQRKAICFGFDDALRLKVDNNWFITGQRIGSFLNADQQDLVKQIFMGLHSPDYAQKVLGQVEHDNGRNGFGRCSIALFGVPGEAGADGASQFEFVLTGRHVTRRCDGNSVAGAAFGGPIFYGHAAQGFNEPAHHPGNVYWYQAERANAVFQMLDGKQREQALRTDARKERGTATVELSKDAKDMHGIPIGELSADQKEVVRQVMADLLAPFRQADADEALKLIDAAGGLDALHMAFYKNMDIGDDGVWDVWQLEGPAMVWYFRGAPHVHTWVNIRDPKAT